VAPPAKVDELPPKIDEPTPVAPLENPASQTPAADATATPAPAPTTSEEPVKPIETPAVVAAAA
jgi:hypothetical protein